MILIKETIWTYSTRFNKEKLSKLMVLVALLKRNIKFRIVLLDLLHLKKENHKVIEIYTSINYVISFIYLEIYMP